MATCPSCLSFWEVAGAVVDLVNITDLNVVSVTHQQCDFGKVTAAESYSPVTTSFPQTPQLDVMNPQSSTHHTASSISTFPQRTRNQLTLGISNVHLYSSLENQNQSSSTHAPALSRQGRKRNIPQSQEQE